MAMTIGNRKLCPSLSRDFHFTYSCHSFKRKHNFQSLAVWPILSWRHMGHIRKDNNSTTQSVLTWLNISSFISAHVTLCLHFIHVALANDPINSNNILKWHKYKMIWGGFINFIKWQNGPQNNILHVGSIHFLWQSG